MVKNAEKFYENNASYLSNAVKNQSDFHSKNLQHFKDARDAYLQQVLFLHFDEFICISWVHVWSALPRSVAA